MDAVETTTILSVAARNVTSVQLPRTSTSHDYSSPAAPDSCRMLHRTPVLHLLVEGGTGRIVRPIVERGVWRYACPDARIGLPCAPFSPRPETIHAEAEEALEICLVEHHRRRYSAASDVRRRPVSLPRGIRHANTRGTFTLRHGRQGSTS